MKFTAKILLILTSILLSLFRCKAQPSRQLDSLLQGYAYRALHNPKSGTVYNASIPSNLTGINLQVVRLRSGSLRLRGVDYLEEFKIPDGVITKPYVVRLALVYQNLGNWSTFYYPLSGYSYLTPVIGLLAYDAQNLSATNLNELDIIAANSPILVRFSNVRTVVDGEGMECVWFDLKGSYEFQKMVSSNVCSSNRQGHFAIVTNVTMPPPSLSPSPSISPLLPPLPKLKRVKVWKIVVGVVSGFVGLVILALAVFCMVRERKVKKMKEMEETANTNEALQMARVGGAQAPFASGTRTLPMLEQEYNLPK